MSTSIMRHTDEQGRVTLPQGFEDHVVIIESVDANEVRIRKANSIPEAEVWLWQNPMAFNLVQQGLLDAKEGKVLKGPDLESIAKEFDLDNE